MELVQNHSALFERKSSKHFSEYASCVGGQRRFGLLFGALAIDISQVRLFWCSAKNRLWTNKKWSLTETRSLRRAVLNELVNGYVIHTHIRRGSKRGCLWVLTPGIFHIYAYRKTIFFHIRRYYCGCISKIFPLDLLACVFI